MTEVQAIITGAIIGGGIALVAAFFSYRWSRSVSLESIRTADFNKAATKFRAAFIPQIAYLTHNADIHSCGNLREVLSHSYLRGHLQALEIFKPHLSPIDQRNIEKAWKDYCHPDGEYNGSAFSAYGTELTSGGKIRAYGKEVALEKLNNLLKFATFK